MAESEANVKQKEEKDENEQDLEDDSGKTSTSSVLKKIGLTLKWLLFALLLLHMHFIGCCCYCLMVGIGQIDSCSGRKYEIIENMVVAFMFLSPSMTSVFVVIMINDVGKLYPEIQSWQIAYITWSACVSIAGWFIYVFLVILNDDVADAVEAQRKAAKWLLYPFGIKPSDAGDSDYWSLPLVSLAPAMVSGFLANFFLDTKYLFDCDKSAYDSISDICFDDEGVCCMAISSHTAPITFMATLASTILAAWGVVKSIGYLICMADDEVVIDNTEEEEKTKKMVKIVMRSESMLKAMRETIDERAESESD